MSASAARQGGKHRQGGKQLYATLPKLPKTNRPEWATFVFGRSPDFKMHTGLGHAKNAIRSSGHGVLYRWMSEWNREPDWTPVAIIERDTIANHPAMQPKVVPIEPVVAYLIMEEP